MSNISDIFKAYDIRGKVNEELTPEVTYLIGKAFADWLTNPNALAIGYDMRPDSKDLAESLIKGLMDQGKDVNWILVK